jgi:hypothetical protein
MGPSVYLFRQMDARQQAFRMITAFGPRPLPECGSHVAGGREVWEERIVLKDEPYGSPVRRSKESRRGISPGIGSRAHTCMQGPIEACNASQDRRFAAAGWPENGEDIAGLTVEVDVERNGS